MARYGTITLDECLASAKLRLKIKTSDSDIFLMDMANEAVRHLDSPSIFLKQICTVDIDDNKSKLPCGFWRLIAARFGEGDTCQDMIYANLDYLTSCGCTVQNNVMNNAGVFEIQNGWIYYHTLPENTTSATISFWGLNLDSNGLAVVYEDYRRAIVAYICYIYCLQNSSERELGAQTDAHYQTWVAQKKWIKSNDVQNEFAETKHQTRAIMNALLVDKRNWRTI